MLHRAEWYVLTDISEEFVVSLFRIMSLYFIERNQFSWNLVTPEPLNGI
jgi:hypothetical protein